MSAESDITEPRGFPGLTCPQCDGPALALQRSGMSQPGLKCGVCGHTFYLGHTLILGPTGSSKSML
jgi:hypothetical protein